VDGYKSLDAWRLAQQLSIGVLRATDGPMPRRSWAVLDQLRRAALSADINLVEGYALGTAPLFRRHARIALGSAAEAQRLLVIAAGRGYLAEPICKALLDLADRTVACLVGLLRSRSLPFG
jgi:four helix bundle protein